MRMHSQESKEFEAKVCIYRGYVLSPFLLAVVIDVVTELATVGSLFVLVYADDLVLMSETIKEFRSSVRKWKEVFES